MNACLCVCGICDVNIHWVLVGFCARRMDERRLLFSIHCPGVSKQLVCVCVYKRYARTSTLSLGIWSYLSSGLTIWIMPRRRSEVVKFCTGASRLQSEIDNDPAQSQVPFIRNSSGESGHAVDSGLGGGLVLRIQHSQ